MSVPCLFVLMFVLSVRQWTERTERYERSIKENKRTNDRHTYMHTAKEDEDSLGSLLLLRSASVVLFLSTYLLVWKKKRIL